ncbi:MAG: hypothetical protein AVDCRST_MAG49-617 [uncultured Thermomicrobiales bacterium]|uniref:SnoaL-like domain-containing protein n=1 Tax=uncultured Thermomicrobiales bacterium TaxID=1645740 RepID=A0A6J4U5K8_9BACT|nr:MAG: hypothetical protein AVDCRST_MAG49-617 [uncultured Thermomicrobiales bacterium]
MATGDQVARAFIDALWELEGNRNADPIVGTYADDADIGNVVSPRTFTGQDGARDFWSRYRANFGEMRSEFRNVFATEDRAALEWTTKGTSPEGHPVEYEGVSLLEIDPASGAITRFRAFFDPSKLGRQLQQD